MRTMSTVLLLALAFSGCAEDKGQKIARRLEKMNRMRILAGLLIVSEKLPTKDGRLDVYALARKGDIGRENYKVFRDPSGDGPTDAEIERGDYANFPYHRYGGSGEMGYTSVPLLWDKEPDSDGQFVVAMSDGSVRSVQRPELDAMQR